MKVRKPAVSLIIFLFVFSFVALLSSVPKVQSATTNIPVSADSFVYNTMPDTNYGSDDSLDIEGIPTFYFYMRVWVKVDLSTVPNGVSISNAKLWLKTNIHSISGPPSVSIHFSSTDSWTESGITWNNAPSFDSGLTSTTVSSTNTWYSWTVTSVIQNEYVGDKTVSLLLKVSESSNTYCYFYSRDYNGDNPYLEVTYTYYPVIGTVTATTTSSYWYAQYATYEISVPVTDGDGYSDIVAVRIRIGDSNHEYWWSETSFTEWYDVGNYYTLQAGGTYGGSGNVRTVIFKLKVDWTAVDGLKTVYAFAQDSTSKWDGWDNEGNLFTVETDLSSSGLTASDYRCNPSQALTMSGYWYYQGAGTTPPDGDYQVKVKLSGVQKGSTDTTLVSGAFSIGISAESTVGSYTYAVEASYMTGAGTFSNVIVDKILVTVTANTTNPINTDKVQLTTSAKYQYDNADVSTLSFQMTRNGSAFATSSPMTDGPYTDTIYVYTISSASETTHGLNTFSTNTVTVTWGSNIFIEVWQIIADMIRTDIGSDVYLRYRLRFGGNQSAVNSGTISVNSASHAISSGWANFTVTSGSVGKVTYVETDVNVNGEHDYSQTPADPEIIWDRLEFVSVAADDIRVNVGATFELRYTIRYDYDNVPFSSTKGSITDFTFDSLNGWWEKSIAVSTSPGLINYDEADVTITDSTYGLTVKQDVSGVNVIADGLRVSEQEIDLAGEKLRLRMLYAYDDSVVASGNVTFNGFYAVTNASGWAEFDFSSFQDFTWGLVAYGVSDNQYGVTDKFQNQTIGLLKISDVIIQTETGLTLSNANYQQGQLSFSVSGSGAKFLRVKAPKPYYVKINTLICLEGTKWTYNTMAQYSEINESYSEKTIFVSWSPLSFDGSGSGGSETKPKTVLEQIGEAVSTGAAVISSNYVGAIVFVLALVGFIVTYYREQKAASVILGCVTFYLLFDLISVFILMPQQLFPGDLLFLQPFLWVPPFIALDIFGPLAMQQLVQVGMMSSLFTLLVAGIYGVSQRN